MSSTTIAHSSATVQPYSRTTVALHWVLAVALIAEWVLGWWMLDLPKSPPGLRAEWFNLHKSIGITIALVVPVRLALNAGRARPGHELLPPWQRQAARVTHAALYLCM